MAANTKNPGWARWGFYLGAIATSLTILGTVLGAAWTVVNDRSNVIQRIVVIEGRAT